MDPTFATLLETALVPALVQVGIELSKSFLRPAKELIEDSVMERFRGAKQDAKITKALELAAIDAKIGLEDSVWLKIVIDALTSPENDTLRMETAEAVITMVNRDALPNDLPDKLRVPKDNRDRLVEFLYCFRRRLVEIPEFETYIGFDDRAMLLRGQNEIKQMVSTLLAGREPHPTVQVLQPPAEPVSPQDQALLSQIDHAQSLRLDGNPNAAKHILLSLHKALEHAQVSDTLRFRLETNLGACELELGNADEAARFFEHALEYAPSSPKAIANVALAKSLKGEYQSAADLAQQALQSDTEKGQTSAIAIRVDALAHLRNFQNVDELYDEKYLNNPDYLRAMGSAFLRAKNLAKAEEIFRQAIRLNQEDEFSLMALGQVIFHRKNEYYKDRVFVSLLHDTFADDLAESEELMNKAVELLQKGDNQPRLHEALAGRAGVRAARGKIAEAIQDCERVLAEDKYHPMALYNRGLVARQQGDLNLAIQCLKTVPEKEFGELGAFFPLAEVYARAGMADEALDTLKSMPADLASSHFLDFFVIESQALLKKGAFREAEERKNTILASHPNNPMVLEACAFLTLQQEHNDAALAYLLSAYEHAHSQDKDRIGLRIASHYCDLHEYEKAIHYFSQVVGLTGTDNPFARQYLMVLYNTRHYAQANQVAQQLLAAGSNHPVVLEILALIGEQTGDLQKAADFYANLAKLQPSNSKYLVAQARVEFRNGKAESARAILLQLKQVKIEDPLDLMSVAQMLASLGETEGVICLAYRARQLASDNPDIHLAYFWVFHYCEKQNPKEFDVSEVGENTAILIQEIGGRKAWWKILLGFPADRSKDEFSKDDPTAQLLMGHRKGALVQIQQGAVEELHYRIEDIQSIYVRAFQETFDNFSTWFPNHGGLSKIHFELNDPSKLLTFVAGHSVRLGDLYKSYENGELAFGQLAALAGKDEVELWDDLAGALDRRLLASLGTQEEQNRLLGNASQAKEITIDIIAILTSFYLETFEYLRSRFTKLYVPQATIDTINRSVMSLSMMEPSGFMSFENGQFATKDVPQEAIAASIARRERLRDTILSQCEIVPISAEFIDRFQNEERGHLHSENSVRTVLVALQTSSYFYSDDLKLRTIAERSLGIRGFWTQSLLQNLRQGNAITQEEYFEKCIRLIQAHYYFTSIDSQLLIYVLEKNSMHINEEVRSVLKTLEGPDTSEDGAIRIVAGAISKAWMSRWLPEQRILVLDESLKAVTTNRQAHTVLKKVVACLGQDIKLQLAAIAYNEIVNQIRMWEKAQRL